MSAPIGKRIAARLLDLIFCLILTFILAVPAGLVAGIVSIFLSDGVIDGWVIPLLATVCYFLAYVGMEVFLLIRRRGQTLGKGLMGLQVIPVGASGETPIPVGLAVVRMLMIFLPFVFMSISGSYPESGILNVIALVGLISLLMSLVMSAIPLNGPHRVLHDFAASTRVVQAGKRKIDLKEDLGMMLPGKVDMTKRM
ncbi:MAG: RDD family protein [Gordonia sp. (in: high G+C Gram-positive bacteria)]|uniref:RDD family protein n=1 Tax=Gordonia sp. (in: high G+C Gram-positive bacteria) TaxID=84139 RepID=UPI0039E52783